MKYRDTWPREVREIMTAWIPMADGTRLAARIWLPIDAQGRPVPALLEYLPYRRRDGTSHRDSVTQPYMAGHGYAAVRVDIRGSGDSDGLLSDEYSEVEIDDGVQLIAWLAAQPWCSGRVGMWGISWGGINALQVAARQPPALHAIMPMGFADDRYNGDCHFMGGCLLEGNISWGGTFFAGNSRPPDPHVVGAGWREIWRRRLEVAEPPLATWLAHQRRDGYWRNASVCEDYGRILAAVYAVSGWQDSYSRNVLPLLENLRGSKKALIGPWAHSWPHLAEPGPAIGFLQEALRWWDHWLKDVDTGIMDEPMLRVWMGAWVAPNRRVSQWPGHWVAEAVWPRVQAPGQTWFLAAEGLREQPGTAQPLKVCSPQTTGMAAGYQCSYGLGPDLSADQQVDDAQSLCFDSLPGVRPLQLLGAPELEIDLVSDQPQAMLAARLCDVAPDGRSLRLSYGLLNLSHRDGPHDPTPLVPGQRYRVRLRLCGLAHTLAPGHRLRLALSNSYWPIAWPSPLAGSLTVLAGGGRLILPLHVADPLVHGRMAEFGPAEGATPQELVELRPRSTDRPQDLVMTDAATGQVDLLRSRDRGAWKTLDTDVSYDTQGELRFSIRPDDPLSASQSVTLTSTLAREDWGVRTQVTSHLSSSADRFFLRATLLAWDDDALFFSRSWVLDFPRDHV
jgi:putative CocE/NonD family hydrolase